MSRQLPLSRRAFAATLGGGALALGATAAGIAGASEQPSGRAGRRPQTRTVRYQGSTGAVTPIELAADLGYLDDIRLAYIGTSISGPQDIQATVTGDTDIGGAFNGAIIRLVAAGAPITSLFGYYGVDRNVGSGYFVPSDSPLRRPRDLVGATVAANTLGGQAEDVLRMKLRADGVSEATAREAQLVVVPPVSAEQTLRSGQLDAAVLTDMLRDKALTRGGLRRLFDDYSVLGRFTCGCQVMREDFVHDNPDTVRTLVAGTARALFWSQRTPRQRVIARMRRIVESRSRPEDTAALPYWKGYGVAATGGLVLRREFTVWRDRLIEAGIVDGRDVPLEGLYTNRFNPYRATAHRAGAQGADGPHGSKHATAQDAQRGAAA